MSVFIWLLISFSQLGWSFYSFPELEKCFLATQVGELPGGKVRYVDKVIYESNTDREKRLKTTRNSEPIATETHFFNALFFQDIQDGKPIVHVIQDINASTNQKTGFSWLFSSEGSQHFSNVRQSFYPPELSGNCNGDPKTFIKIGSYCRSKSGNLCLAQHIGLNVTASGPCDFSTGLRNGNFNPPEGTKTNMRQRIAEALEGGTPQKIPQRDLEQNHATQIVRKAMKYRLESLAILLREQPKVFANKKEEIKAALKPGGTCHNVLRTPDQEISGLAATTLCALDWRDKEICQQGDAGVDSFEGLPLTVPALPATFIVPKDKNTGK